jgi:pimeloyl-ACP methyl ester carboxylesterase
LFYNRSMDNASFIFIHGSSGDKSQTYKAHLLRENFPGMLTPDFDGDLQERMAQLRTILGTHRGWTLIGSSLGGLMAALFTVESPIQVRKLIMLAPALVFPEFRTLKSNPISVPTVLIHGRQDELLTLKEVRALAEMQFSNLEVIEVEDDHRLHHAADNLDWKALLK